MEKGGFSKRGFLKETTVNFLRSDPYKQYTLCLLAFHRPLISYIRKFYYYDPQEEVYLSLKEAQLISKQKQEVEPST